MNVDTSSMSRKYRAAYFRGKADGIAEEKKLRGEMCDELIAQKITFRCYMECLVVSAVISAILTAAIVYCVLRCDGGKCADNRSRDSRIEHSAKITVPRPLVENNSGKGGFGFDIGSGDCRQLIQAH